MLSNSWYPGRAVGAGCGRPAAAAGTRSTRRRARAAIRPRRRGRAPVILVAVTGLALAGCQQVKETGQYLGQQAGVAGRYVSDKFGEATATVSRWASGRPADDETSCYATERVAFYDAVSEVETAESMVFGAGLAGLVGAAVTTYSDSFATRLVSAGFAVTMAALLKEIEADHARIERITSTFDDLMACRRGEATMLKADVSAGRVSRADGQQQMARLRSLVEEDLVVARETNETLQARTTEFELSAEKAKEEVEQPTAQPERAGEPAPPTPQEQREREQEVQKAEAAVQTNQQALSQQSATIEQASTAQQSDEFELAWLVEPSGKGRPART
jgi:hypothetical protein